MPVKTVNSWTKVRSHDFEVNWRDVEVSSGEIQHGSEWVLVEDGELVRIQPDDKPMRFVQPFAVMFLVAFVCVVWALVPSPERWIIIVGGLWCGIPTFAVIWYLLKKSFDAGPAFEANLAARSIELPRLNQKFPLETLHSLQWIRGTSEDMTWDVWTDLNLLVENDDGGLDRYPILGSPLRSHVFRISELLQLPVTEINLGKRGRRDVDLSKVEQKMQGAADATSDLQGSD